MRQSNNNNTKNNDNKTKTKNYSICIFEYKNFSLLPHFS